MAYQHAHQHAQVARQQALARDRLYTDGYIARMLGAMEAPSYFTRLLQFEEHYLQLYITPESLAFLIIGPEVQHAQHTTYISNRRAWLLDYKVRDGGTVVPQRIWSPAAAGDAQRYCRVPKWPIFFVSGDGRNLGIPLTQALAGHISGLLNGRSPAPVGNCHTTNIRVKWPGYNKEETKQIMTKDQTQDRNTVCLEVLARRVAGAVCRIMDLLPNQPCQRPYWRVGRDGITANDVILIGLIQVSQGSWQPILQLSRYVIEPPPPSHGPQTYYNRR